jgi:hypothetical protein
MGYILSPGASAKWARPEALAPAMYAVASQNSKFPLRVPLGQDSWTVLRSKIETLGKEFDSVREISESVSNGANVDFEGLLSKQGWTT